MFQCFAILARELLKTFARYIIVAAVFDNILAIVF